MNLESRNVLITGGGSGLGLACAMAVTRAGGTAAVLDLDVSDAGDYRAYEVDVTDRAAVERAVERAAEDLGGVRVVIAATELANQKLLLDVANRVQSTLGGAAAIVLGGGDGEKVALVALASKEAVARGASAATLVRLRRMKMWYARVEQLLETRMRSLQGASAEKEFQCKKIVALCTGVPIDKVEEVGVCDVVDVCWSGGQECLSRVGADPIVPSF